MTFMIYMWKYAIGVGTLMPQLQRRTSSGGSAVVPDGIMMYVSFIKTSVPSAQRKYHEGLESLALCLLPCYLTCLFGSIFFPLHATYFPLYNSSSFAILELQLYMQ